MAMQFKVEQKGQMYLVVNESTGDVKGRFKNKGEADVQRDRLQREHNDAIEHINVHKPTATESITSDGTQE